MPLKLDAICNPGTHCRTCRDLDGGRKWRAGLSAAFAVPADAPDFTCPRGHRWGEVPLPRWQEPDNYDPRDYHKDSGGSAGCDCA